MSAAARMAASEARRALLARAHIARKEMALSDDSYRAILLRITGCESAAACSDAQLTAVIGEFTRLGWKPKHRRPKSAHPHVRLVWALWRDMKPLLRDGSDAALRRFVQRQAGVADPEWLGADGARKVIEGLKQWRRRLEGGAHGNA